MAVARGLSPCHDIHKLFKLGSDAKLPCEGGLHSMYQMKFTLNTFGKVVIKICSFVVLFRMSVMKSLKNAYSRSDKMQRRSRTLENGKEITLEIEKDAENPRIRNQN